MSKQIKRRRNHAKRHAKARMIRAAADQGPILMEAVGVEWITAADADDGAAKPKRFSMTAYTGGPMQVNSYGPPVVIDLTGLTAKAPVPILRDHDLSRVIGHADEVTKGDSSLKLAGVISGAGPDAAEVQAAANRGFPWKASVGARPDKLEFVGEGVKTEVNGKILTGPLYVARKSTLGETSFVALGADRKATAKVAATAAQYKEHDMKFQEWIEAMGLSLDDLREDQVQKLQAKYDAEVKAAADLKAAEEIKAAESGDAKTIEAVAQPPVVEAPAFDLSGVLLAHEQHNAVIEATGEEYREKVPTEDWAKLLTAARKGAIEAKATALNEQWPAPKLETQHILAAATLKADLMVAERPKGPAIHSSSQDVSMPAIEAAFCRNVGLTDMEKHFTPEVLEASDKYPNLGLQEMLLICASQNGYTGRFRIGNDNLREVIKAAFSTHTATTLLSTTGNKMLLDGFNRVSQTWRQVAAVRNVSDFKAVTAFRLTASMEYEELPPSGEIKHGTVGQETYTMQAKTYAKMFSLNRTDIINDDLGAFDDLRNRIGMGAAIAMNKVFWTAWLAAVNGAAFWTAARGNYQTGAATALGETALNTAVKLFRDATGPDGNLIELEPELLLVPSDLEATARKLYVSQEVRDTTASTKTLVANVYFNRFRPIVVPQLSNSAYTGYSATGWFLLANPAMLASAAMAFLNGVQAPTIESTDADFNTLGIQSRGYHDFGVSMTEYRASVHSVGA
jgi:phage major head subunit gpT-like protein